MSGERIGPFVVERELGRGAMGVVFAARDPVLGRGVAIKLIAAITPSEEDVARLRREAIVLGRLRHPNLLALHAVGLHQGRPYLATDMIEGEALSERLKRAGPLPVDEALDIVEALARGLDYAHGLGVIHRDVKPDNIILNGQQPVLIDFGIASFRGTDPRLTGSAELLGTPSYMAPEQTDPTRDPSPAVDVYALGATLFTLVSGRPPFQGRSVIETLDSLIHRAPPALRSLRAEVPPDVAELCARCLAKDPLDRPTSAAALADELAALRASPPAAAAGVPSGRVIGLVGLFLVAGALIGVGGTLGALSGRAPTPAPPDPVTPTPIPTPPPSEDPPPELAADLDGPPPPAPRGEPLSFQLVRGFSIESEGSQRRVTGLGFLPGGRRFWGVCHSGRLVVLLAQPPWTQEAMIRMPSTILLAKQVGDLLVLNPGGMKGSLVPVPLSSLAGLDPNRDYQITAHRLPPFAEGKSTECAAGLAGVPGKSQNALASYFDRVVEMDLRDGAVVQSWTLPGMDASEALCWLTPDTLLVGATRGKPCLLSATGDVLKRLPVEGAITADVGGEGSERTLGIVDWDGVLWAFDASGELRWRRRAQHARERAIGDPAQADALSRFLLTAAVAIDPGGGLIATGGGAGEIMIWDAKDGSLRGTYQVLNGVVTRIAWSRDRRLLVGGSDGIIYFARVE